MNKFIYLSTCQTCTRILKDLQLPENFVMQDIKKEALSPEEIDALKAQAGSYEALFNRRSQLYRKENWHTKTLSEADYKMLLNKHYSFIKRPIVLIQDEAYIGNSKKIIAAAQQKLNSLRR
ncbi:MAG: ArsC/Spx/MgsR family protein [Flavobacteriaceae bacterium]|nr:ArsC/Spx/MgsR family protein [Flavobacteriaceae bacterium]